MEGLGFELDKLILLKESRLFYYFGLRVFYLGGSYLYGGKGEK